MSVLCPKCKSKNVSSYDSQPMCHEFVHDLDENGKFEGNSYDSEAYLYFECRDCGEKFDASFDLVPQKCYSDRNVDIVIGIRGEDIAYIKSSFDLGLNVVIINHNFETLSEQRILDTGSLDQEVEIAKSTFTKTTTS